jgi:hypothetical protein
MSYTLWNKSLPKRARHHIANWTRPSVAMATVVVLLAFIALLPQLRADPLLTYPLRVGGQTVRAEVANTPETRLKGLMFRTRLAASSGMIFIFPESRPISMWMKNTPIPLSVAFIDSTGRIINIEMMQPHSEQTHASKRPAKYALEVNQGWFREHGIKAGDQVSGLKRLPPPK